MTEHKSGNGKLIKGKQHQEDAHGLFPAFSATGQDIWVSEPEHSGDAIVISAVGARCGKSFMASGRWSAVANTHVVWGDARAVDLKWLWLRLNDEDFWVKGGSAQPFVKVGATFERELELPPLAEQRRIVAKLDALTARTARARADLDRIPALTARYRDAVLLNVIQAPDNPNWTACELGSLGKWSSGGTPKSGDKSFYGGSIPWIRSGDLNDGAITDHVMTITEAALSASSAKWVPEGTILVAMYGATIGRVAVTTYPVTTNQAVACLRPDRTKVTEEYAFWLLRALKPAFVAAGQGGAQPNISQAILKSWRVRIPTLDRQGALVSEVTAAFAEIDRLATAAAAARRLLDRLDWAVLAKAFRGDLVPQDPADEPASTLLSRLAASRSATPKAHRGRKTIV